MSEENATDTAENSLPQVFPVDIPLEMIRTDTIRNLRSETDDAAVEAMAESLYHQGMLQPPGCIVTSDDEGNITEAHAIYGLTRIAGARLLNDWFVSHNESVADESIAEVEAEGYLFVDGDGEVITTELALPFESITVMAREADEVTDEVIEEAHRANLTENMTRTNLNIGDAIRGVCEMLKSGMTQGAVGQAVSLSQGSVSQYASVGAGVTGLITALQKEQIKLNEAVKISKIRTKTGKPDKKAQNAELKKLLDSKKSGEKVAKEKTKRTPAEVSIMYANLSSPDCFVDMDPDRREAIRATIVWFFCGCEDEALTSGAVDDIDFESSNIPVKKAPPVKKPPAKAASKPAASKPAAKKPAAKKPAAAAADGDAAAAEPAKKRRRRRTRS